MPAHFPAAMKSMDFSDIPVTCSGPAELARGVEGGGSVTLDWSARMTLIAYRTRLVKTFTGNQPMPLIAKATRT